ncbi:MAG: DUF6549 family protein [Prevotella sp.]
MKLEQKFDFTVILLIVCMIIALIVSGIKESESSKYKKENERLKVELAHAAIDGGIIRTDTIRDSIPVYTSQTVTVDKPAFKELADLPLLKEINVKPAQAEEYETRVTEIHDTVYMTVHPPDSVLEYKDNWASFRLSLRDSSLVYSVRDSVTAVVYREYKHRFLWWKWGTKGYKVKLINFNPHSTIQYEQFVMKTR